MGWSPTSFLRTISSSWSLEVVKKPPRSSAEKRSIIDSPVAPRVEGGPGLAQLGRLLGAGAERDMEDVPALEVPSGAHSPVAEDPLDRVGRDPRIGQRLAHLVLLPDVEAALLSV